MKRIVLATSLLAFVAVTGLHAQTSLAGLWQAKKRLGPDAHGALLITRTDQAYSADIAGITVPVSLSNGELTFELPNRAGGFRGRLRGGTIRGVWFASGTNTATPVSLMAKTPNRWEGQVVPLEDTQTFFLLLSPQTDGSYSVLLRNIERDWGAALRLTKLLHSGSQVSLITQRGSPARDTALFTGAFDSARQVITFNFPFRGGSHDFRRDGETSAFYPRPRNAARYVYRVPPALDDGWATASVTEAGLDRAAVERMVQNLIDMSMDSMNAPQVHSLLIARGGKLVLEEYFHGEHRDKLHNLRSAAKSITATHVGAAMLAGAPIELSTPVYQVMNGGSFPAELEPRKRAMTLEHLLSMSSGYFCDDSNPAAPGNEDALWDRDGDDDFWAYGLKVPMATAPGEVAVYCSMNPNLALGMLGRAMNESPFYSFPRLVADPLNITHYAWTLDRARNPYGGGGMALRTRDFMKFGQLMLGGGTWNGRRVLSREFVARATSPMYQLGARKYGLAWWSEEKPYDNRNVRAFAALGAGGQIVMVFPELDLVVATTGGSYISRGWRFAGGELITNYILPAVEPER